MNKTTPKQHNKNTRRPIKKDEPSGYTPNPLFIEAKQLRMKKRFSQNMLISQKTLDDIVTATTPSSGDTIVEIGPGMGFLTRQLLESDAENITAIELDKRMLSHLTEHYGQHPKLNLINCDILKFNFDDIKTPKFKVVGNLPYNITTPILFKLCGELDETNYPLRERLRNITLMVQKEVGQRITAKAGVKGYNALTIAVQNWFETTYVTDVPANAFYPAPKVQSAVIQLTPRESSLVPETCLNTMKKLVQTGFHQKRKILKNAWQGLLPAEKLQQLCDLAEQQGIEKLSTKRAEQISIEEFGKIATLYESLL